MSQPRDAVIGAGIVGLALAHALAQRGRRVTVFEAGRTARGASVRNFGTLWPIGQPAGPRRDLAMESACIWRDVLKSSGAWWSNAGSLHVAYHELEWQVLSEFAASANAQGFHCELLDAHGALACQPRLRRAGLRGALWSPHEIQIDPRQIAHLLPLWLAKRWRVQFEFGVRATSCEDATVRAGTRKWSFDRIWLATGDDLQTLYPEVFASLGLIACKLQMMRTAPVPWHLGPILAAGLTLGHYSAFAPLPGLAPLKTFLQERWPRHVSHGIHVLVAQHENGDLIVGDSHEYGDAVTPFDNPEIDELVWSYLRTFLDMPAATIVERWHGVYVKHPKEPYCVLPVEDRVVAVAALGGHGMTLSFGLAEEVVRTHLDTVGTDTSVAQGVSPASS